MQLFPLCVGSTILGTANRHLLIESPDAVKWVDKIPNNAWAFTGTPRDRSLCFDTLLTLSCENLNTAPPEKYVRMLSQLSRREQQPWQKLLSAEAFRSFVKSLVQRTLDAMDRLCVEYYKSTWAHSNKILQRLEPAKIDLELYRQFQSSDQGNLTALNTFEPDERGYSKKTSYTRLNTRTGRLTRVSGADFLTLSREHRKMLASRFGINGRIYSLDFAALEVRVLLYHAGADFQTEDLYDEISRTSFQGKLSRKLVKNALIATLFGKSVHGLSKQLGIDYFTLNDAVTTLHQVFELPKLLVQLKKQYMENNMQCILNKHGRKVEIDAALDNIFISSFAQSTGVDVALLGFEAIMERLDPTLCVPIGVIHDAVIIDCHREAKKELKEIKTVKVDAFEQQFYLKRERISK